jgi:formylglycine-generating enzyme required for sulfatase activity
MPDNPATPHPAVAEPGTTIGPYRVASVLADGPPGPVYEAVETVTGRRVALRRLPDRIARDPAALNQVFAATGGRLRHPNLVAVDRAERFGPDAYLVMEFVGGRPAGAGGGRVSWRLATRIIRDAARALAAVHNAGLVHGKVRPGHLLISHDGAVKLADLGVTGFEEIHGDGSWIAPEQVRGLPPTAASDLYSLGAVYFTLLSGRRPFAEAGSTLDVFDAVLHRPIPTVRTGAPDIPLRCDIVVEKAMAKDPAKRYPTADAMLADLDALLAADEPARPLQLPTLPPLRPARSRLPLVVGGVVLLAGLAAGAWYVFGPPLTGSATKPSTRATQPTMPTVTNSIGMILVKVPAGRFQMGDPMFPDARPVHAVDVSRPFMIGGYEVTQGQYKAVMDKDPAEFQGPAWATRPVEQVTWAEAVAFCEKLSARQDERSAGRVYRLPTEAEWEYACRAGTTTAFSLGDKVPPADTNTAQAGYLATTPVGDLPPNPWRLYEVHGNVAEWCSDWYGPESYRTAKATDPTGPAEGARRVIRGGSWESAPADCRSGARGAEDPAARSPRVGFRVVCTIVGER